MASKDILARYAAMAELSARMLGAAQRGDWDTVVENERRCRALAIEQAALPEPALSAEERARKFRLIHQVLADDAAIRDLAEPRLRQLGELLEVTGNARRLDACYRN